MHFSPALSPALRRTTRLALVSCGLIALLAGCGGDSVTAVAQRVAVSASPNGIAVRAADGAVSVLANDFQDARGVAVDAPRHQLYAIDRAPGTGGTSYVRIFPLN
ncbi:hypothetical protein [Paraburkholderia sediminicola]|uniref:hypothetical protein n=1 Tax=Paraburkholderia sediminicola TaxID=458836 RepID=UPI0038B9A9AF